MRALIAIGASVLITTIAMTGSPAGSAFAGATFMGPTAGPEDELPDGEGKKILLSSCTSCHELTEVTKFRGYYNRDQWRDIVVTMMEYGAPVDSKQVEVLADYLAASLGKH
ncbi:MAG TPA: cytochrome c [Vicinamibacterales bacterium]